jgi:hypothetical protein
VRCTMESSSLERFHHALAVPGYCMGTASQHKLLELCLKRLCVLLHAVQVAMN